MIVILTVSFILLLNAVISTVPISLILINPVPFTSTMSELFDLKYIILVVNHIDS